MDNSFIERFFIADCYLFRTKMVRWSIYLYSDTDKLGNK